MAKGKVILSAIKSLEENAKEIQKREKLSDPMYGCVKTLNETLLALLKNETA